MYFQRCTDYVDILWRSAAMARQTREGRKTSYFRAKFVNISKTVRDTSKVTIRLYVKVHALSIGTKIDDLGRLG